MRLPSVIAALSLSILPGTLHAQLRQAGLGGEAAGWAPAAVGVRAGYDNSQSRPMLGAVVRIPVLPNGRLELLPNADVTFLPGLKQYQVNFEVVYLTDGRRGGIYGGGGIGFRHSIFGPDPNADPRNEGTFSLVVGLRLGGLGRFRPEVETRWILTDQQVRDPRLVAFGVSVALW